MEQITVLIVDDDGVFGETIAAFLEQEGDFSVKVATTGTKGLQQLKDDEIAYDCVVSDYQMPGMDGLELLEEVRKEWPDLPFLLLTSHGSESVASEAISAGVTDYVEKQNTSDQRTVLANRITNAVTKHRAKEALEQERVFTQRALDSLDDIFYIAEPDGTLRYWNDTLSTVTGYDDAEIADMQVRDFLDGNSGDIESIPSRCADIPIGESCTVESTIQTANGERLPYECTVTPLVGRDETDSVLVGVARDLTEREQREKTLRTLKERFELAVKGANLGIWDWDMRTDEVEFNDNWATMLGYNPDDIESHLESWERRVHPDDLGEVEAALEAHIEGETPYYDTEHRMRTADGGWKWIRDIGQVVERDADGKPTRAVGIHLDIDDRKQVEQTLREEREMFAQGPAVVFKWENDGDSTVSYVSENVEEVFGCAVSDLESRSFQSFIHAEDRDRVLDETEAAMASGDSKVEHDPYRIVTGDGDVRWVLDHTTIVRKNETVSHRIGYLIDITDRKRREQQLERKNEQLDNFAGVVSHDLRNPLNVAQGRAELAQMDCECGNEHLEEVDAALKRMQTLIENLLAIARHGESVSDPEPVGLSTIVSTCWCSVETPDAELEADVSMQVLADRSRLRQLLENLFANAVDHGGDNVTVTVGELDGEDGFFVADDGPGIPEDERDDIFSSGYSTAADGNGFGLAIVREIAEAHEWNLRVTESGSGGARIEVADVTVSGA